MKKKPQKKSPMAPKQPKVGQSVDDIFATKPKAHITHAQAPKPIATPKPVVVEAPTPLMKAPTPPHIDEKPVAARGRPTVHVGGSQKCTVVLLNDQIHWLKLLEHSIYLASQTTISRAELIRAMIDAVIESGIDLSHFTSEPEIKEHILNILKKHK